MVPAQAGLGEDSVSEAGFALGHPPGGLFPSRPGDRAGRETPLGRDGDGDDLFKQGGEEFSLCS